MDPLSLEAVASPFPFFLCHNVKKKNNNTRSYHNNKKPFCQKKKGALTGPL